MQGSPGTSARHPYFPYIDGLRAFAVLAVLIYHLHAAWLPGGFIGVDVFFVISGFVVSASVANFRGGIFQFLTYFYARRIKRIFPALIACLLLTALASALFIPASWLSAVNQETGRSAFFGLSNFILARTGRDYFAPTTEFNPYTHTWSLGVEEQFYVVFPLLFLAWLSGGRYRWVSTTLLIASVVASGFYSSWQSAADPTAAFFLSPGRLWELGIGVLLFQLVSTQTINLKVSREDALWRAIPGGAFFLILLYAFVVSRPVGFPMPGAVMAVVATAGTILSLHSLGYNNVVNRFIGNAFFVAIGRISYSLYLWHWPVFVLFRWTCGLDSWLTRMLAVLVAFIFAIASYVLIEKPLRYSRFVRRSPEYAVILGGLVVVFCGWSLSGTITDNSAYLTQSVVSKNASVWYPEGADANPAYPGCSSGPDLRVVGGGTYFGYSPRGCTAPAPLKESSIYVIGDSHAMAYTGLFKQFSIINSVRVNSYNNGGCPFISFQPHRDIDNPVCKGYAESAINDIQSRIKAGDILFLPSLRLPRFVDQWVFFGEESVRSEMLGPNAEAARKKATVAAVSVLQDFAKKGVRIVFEAPKPVFKAPPLRCADWFDRANPICKEGFNVSRQEIEELRQPVIQAMKSIAQQVPGVEIWDPLPTLCPDKMCNAFDNGVPLFFDGDHLSAHGNLVLLPSFSQFFNARLGKFPSVMSDPYVLSNGGIPAYMSSIVGFSALEGFGRWTDANLGPAKLIFAESLPSEFVLEITASAYGANVGKPVKLIAGGVVREVSLTANQASYRVAFNGVVNASSIDIVPPEPISPHAFEGASDDRKLGVALGSIKIIPSGSQQAALSAVTK